MIDYAIKNSKVLSDYENVHLWKITGRYSVLNLTKVIKCSPKEYSIYCDLKTMPDSWLDLRFMSYTPLGFEQYFSPRIAPIKPTCIR